MGVALFVIRLLAHMHEYTLLWYGAGLAQMAQNMDIDEAHAIHAVCHTEKLISESLKNASASWVQNVVNTVVLGLLWVPLLLSMLLSRAAGALHVRLLVLVLALLMSIALAILPLAKVSETYEY